MSTTSIERAKLKGYTSSFTMSPIVNDDTKSEGLVSLMTDSELLPLIKLLHSVHVQGSQDVQETQEAS